MKMMKTDMEIIAFDVQDVIMTSGKRTITMSGFQDGEDTNLQIIGSDGTLIYDATQAGHNADTLLANLNQFFGGGSYFAEESRLYDTIGNESFRIRDLPEMENNTDMPCPAVNGVYEWISTEGKLQQMVQ